MSNCEIGEWFYEWISKKNRKKREDILNATKKLVCDIPLDRLSIIKIADEANVSQVTIYNLYENKKTADQ